MCLIVSRTKLWTTFVNQVLMCALSKQVVILTGRENQNKNILTSNESKSGNRGDNTSHQRVVRCQKCSTSSTGDWLVGRRGSRTCVQYWFVVAEWNSILPFVFAEADVKRQQQWNGQLLAALVRIFVIIRRRKISTGFSQDIEVKVKLW